MSRYPQVPLGEICTVNPRARKFECPDDTVVSFVPMAAIDEQAGAIVVREERPLAEVEKGYTSFEDGDILFAKITPCMENGKVALARNLANGIGRGSTEFYVLRPGERVLGEYMYHFLRQPRFREEAKRNFTGTAGQQRVPKPFMQNAPIPLPPLPEQRRIVGILNRAARIERLRRQAQERLREFIPGLFVKMFGDPATNPMGWDTARLGEICKIAGGGTPRRSTASCFGGSIPWATPTDVTALSGLFIGATKETITQTGLRESNASLLPARTVLFTSRATIGCTAIAVVPMATNQGFANLTCSSRLSPEYLAIWLQMRRDHLIRLAGGTTFREISKSTLRLVEAPLPPVVKQERFSETVDAALAVSLRAGTGSKTASSLNAALLSRLLEEAA